MKRNDYDYANSQSTTAGSQVELSENLDASIKDAEKHRILKHISAFRTYFASNCESSHLSFVLDNLYIRILNLPLRVLALFLFTFSVSSLALGFAVKINYSSFVSSSSTYVLLITLLISLIFFTSKKRLYELFNTSSLLSGLYITYDESILRLDNYQNGVSEGYSTAFFLGILSGIITLLYPAFSITAFLLSLLYILFIINRPECGILFTTFMTPFLNEKFAMLLCAATFISLIYKYLRKKRHISINRESLLLFVLCIMLLLSGIFNSSGIPEYKASLKFIIPILMFFSIINLIRSTAMLRRCLKLIVSFSRFYVTAVIISYVYSIFFNIDSALSALSGTPMSYILSAVSDHRFYIPFITLSIPINLSLALKEKKTSSKVTSLVTVFLLFFCTIGACSYTVIFTLLISCAIVVSMFKKKASFILLLCPFAAGLLSRLYRLVPDTFKLFSVSDGIITKSTLYNTYLEVFKDHSIFGIGIGKENFNSVFRSYFPTELRDLLPESLYTQMLLCLGIAGSLLVFIIVGIIIYKCFKFTISNDLKSESAKAISIGLFASVISFAVMGLYFNVFADSRLVIMFCSVLALCYVAPRCYEADYIDRESQCEYDIY